MAIGTIKVTAHIRIQSQSYNVKVNLSGLKEVVVTSSMLLQLYQEQLKASGNKVRPRDDRRHSRPEVAKPTNAQHRL